MTKSDPDAALTRSTTISVLSDDFRTWLADTQVAMPLVISVLLVALIVPAVAAVLRTAAAAWPRGCYDGSPGGRRARAPLHATTRRLSSR